MGLKAIELRLKVHLLCARSSTATAIWLSVLRCFGEIARCTLAEVRTAECDGRS